MGRAARRDGPGAWHHVMHRGAGRRLVFRDDGDRQLLVDLVSELDTRFGIEVHAYCLMGNHFHLLIRSREAALSVSMQWLMSTFTKAVNLRRGLDGPIFRGRFHSVLVESDGHLDWLFRYINANPRDLGWDRPLIEYPWSGFAGSVGWSQTLWLRTDYVRARFGDESKRFIGFVDPSESTQSSPLFARGCDLKSIAAAAEIAIAPGPEVHSRADARRVVAVVGADVAGCELGELFPRDSRQQSQQRQLNAARSLIAGRPDLERFRGRVIEALQSEQRRASDVRERRLTPFATTPFATR